MTPKPLAYLCVPRVLGESSEDVATRARAWLRWFDEHLAGLAVIAPWLARWPLSSEPAEIAVMRRCEYVVYASCRPSSEDLLSVLHSSRTTKLLGVFDGPEIAREPRDGLAICELSLAVARGVAVDLGA